MATARKLVRFDLSGSADAYTLRIEDNSGQTFEVIATRDQLDIMADALDDVLLKDDSADEPA